jgi:hypothetical protein
MTFSFSPLLPMCSHQVPNELQLSFPSFQHLPQHIPSSTSLPSQMFWQVLSSFHPYYSGLCHWPKCEPIANYGNSTYYIVLQGIYLIFEELNLKGSHS